MPSVVLEHLHSGIPVENNQECIFSDSLKGTFSAFTCSYVNMGGLLLTIYFIFEINSGCPYASFKKLSLRILNGPWKV